MPPLNIHGTILYPKAEDVFHDHVERHRSVLLPYLIMPLDLVIPGATQMVPWVIPHETEEGFIGADTVAHHSYYSRENWIGFHLIENRLKFDADFAYFLGPAGVDVTGGEMQRYYQKVEAGYRKAMEEAEKSPIALIDPGYLQAGGRSRFLGIGIFERIGRKPHMGGNWICDMPTCSWAGERAFPVDEHRQPLIFLGVVRTNFHPSFGYEVLGFITQDLKRVAFSFIHW